MSVVKDIKTLFKKETYFNDNKENTKKNSAFQRNAPNRHSLYFSSTSKNNSSNKSNNFSNTLKVSNSVGNLVMKIDPVTRKSLYSFKFCEKPKTFHVSSILNSNASNKQSKNYLKPSSLNFLNENIYDNQTFKNNDLLRNSTSSNNNDNLLKIMEKNENFKTLTTDSYALKRRSSTVDTMGSQTAISHIKEFVETSIVLKKDKNNELGINVIGGSDTYLESICVCEVHVGGAAYSDGRLRKGDLILAVNEFSFRTINYLDAVRVLREASSPLKLLILRENPQKLFTTSQNVTKFITVELKKNSIKDKLGISIMQRTNGRGVFVTYVTPGSIAAAQGRRIMQGDQLLEINGQNVRESNQKDVRNQINELDGEIVLLLGRVSSLTMCIQDWCRKRMQIHWRTRTSTWSAYGGSKDKIKNQRPSLPIGKEIPQFSAKSPEETDNCNNLQIKNIDKNQILNVNTYNLNTAKNTLFQQVSDQLNLYQEKQNQFPEKTNCELISSPKYSQPCFNTPKDVLSFSRSSSLRSNNRLGILIENPFNHEEKDLNLKMEDKNKNLSQSSSMFSINYGYLFKDADENYELNTYKINLSRKSSLNSGYVEIEPLDENTCYLAEKLDAQDKFVPFEERDQEDQKQLYEKQLKQQRLIYKEERQQYQKKYKTCKDAKNVSNENQQHQFRTYKPNFLHKRSSSSKAASKSTKKQLPSIQVIEF